MPHFLFFANTTKSRLFVLAFMLVTASCGVAAESLNPPSLTVQAQIAVLKKQNQEMRTQIEALKQQRWQTSPSRRGGDAAPPVVLITNGKDASADVQSLKQAIEAMNDRS